MPAKTSRELEIKAVMKDFVTASMKKVARNIKRLVKTGLLAPFKLFGKALLSTKTLLIGMAVAAGSLFAVWRAGKFAKTIIEDADALNKLAQSTDSTVESISVLKGAFEFAGLGAENFTAIMTGLGRATSTVLGSGGATTKQADAFRTLGISLEDLRSGDKLKIFEQMARGLEQFNSAAKKGEVLYPLFPDNFLKILPLLDDLENGFLKNVNAARAFGAGLSQGLATAASDTAFELLQINTALSNIARGAVLTFAKKMEPFLIAVSEFLKQNNAEIARALADAMLLLANAIQVVAKQVVWLLTHLPQVRTVFRDLLKDIPLVGAGLLKMFDAATGTDAAADKWRSSMNKLAAQIQFMRELIVEMGKTEITDRMAKTISAMGFKTVADIETRILKFQAKLRSTAHRAFGAGANAEIDQAEQIARVRRAGAKFFGVQKKPGVTVNARGGGDDKGDAGSNEAREGWGAFWKEFSLGVDAATDQIGDFEKAAKAAGTAVANAVSNNLSQAFTDIITGAKKAKDAFKDMARAVLDELAKIISKLITAKIVQTFFAAGGVTKNAAVSATVPVKRFAKGGVVESPTIALFGEAGSEAFVPLASGKIPVRIENSQPSIPQINITIHAMDGADVKRVLAREKDLLRDLGMQAMVESRAYQQAIARAGGRR